MVSFLSAALGTEIIVLIGSVEKPVTVIKVTNDKVTLRDLSRTYVLHPTAVVVVSPPG